MQKSIGTSSSQKYMILITCPIYAVFFYPTNSVAVPHDKVYIGYALKNVYVCCNSIHHSFSLFRVVMPTFEYSYSKIVSNGINWFF